MTRAPFVNARDVEGVQHCHGEHCDEYYYRPLVYGKDLFTYIAHIPPGGGVPPDAEESSMYELSLYILDGRPTVLYGDDRFVMHPHTALQTVTWLVDGEVRHRDSLGNDQLIRPGQLNLMTAGRGIAHAEDSTQDSGRTMRLHGVQLWVALPQAAAGVDPAFAHHADLPSFVDDGVETRQERVLDVELFDNGLHDEVRLGQVLE